VEVIRISKTRIVIIGGGFGGVKCALTLRRSLSPSNYEIALFNQENHMVFSPLLADVVGSSLNPLDAVVPLRQLLPGVLCRTADVQNIDLAKQEIEYEGDNGQLSHLRYDQLVIASGNIANLGVIPGMADHSFPLKTIGDAVVLRSHILQQMEKAEVSEDPVRRRWHLSFIIVGGGFSGVEVAGEINDLVRSSLHFFQNIKDEDITVIIIHSQDQILPEMGSELREFARSEMEKAGVKMRLNCPAKEITPEGVTVGDGEIIRGGTVVSTIGNTIAPVIKRLEVTKERGKLVTEPDMRLPGYSNVWAVGDCATIINSYDNKPSPPTGQFAERQGRQVAENIIRVLKNQPTKPFRFKPLGQLCSIGRHTGVAELFGFHISGFLAWFVWRGVYLFKLPSWARRIQVGFDWAWEIIFPRDLSSIKTSMTDRIFGAHYQSGEHVFRQGDPATNFYVIEKGEAEVLRTGAENHKEEIVSVLGPGSFFGERALIDNQPHKTAVRARTSLDVVVMGRNAFTQISKSLSPLRNALAEALNRRTVDIWQDWPQAYEILRQTPLTEFIELAPEPMLKPTITLREVSKVFSEYSNEFFYVASDGVHLEGIVTFTDLTRAFSSGAKMETPLAEFMIKEPIAVSIKDTSLVAVSALRDYRLKSIPVVDERQGGRIAGYISARKMMAYVLRASDKQ